MNFSCDSFAIHSPRIYVALSFFVNNRLNKRIDLSLMFVNPDGANVTQHFKAKAACMFTVEY